MRSVFGMTSKKGLHVILRTLGAMFLKLKRVGCHFYQYFQGVC